MPGNPEQKVTGFEGVAEKMGVQRIVPLMEEAVLSPNYAENPNQVYDNMDGDPRIADDAPTGSRPASRRELLESIRAAGTAQEVKKGIRDFCHSHKKEGPDSAEGQTHVLGRMWDFEKLAESLQDVTGLSPDQARIGLRNIISNLPVEHQRLELQRVGLSPKLMWSFYDAQNPQNPYAGLGKRRPELVDRLGLGEYDGGSEELVCWGHRLPASIKAYSATAWDAGSKRPYWRPGGRTHPLTSDASKGVPEVVHDPVSGACLDIKIDFVLP